MKGATIPADVARLFNTSSQVLKNWENRGISKAGILRAQEVIGCRAEWLETGKGSMTLGLAPAENRPSYALTGMSTWDDATPLNSDDVEIPLFKEVELSAGDGAAHAIEINGRKLRFSKATLKAAGVDIANAACATVSGNSMERLISDGATIGVDRGRTQIRDGEIYAIDQDGMLRVKYLYRIPGGGLRLRSENSSEHPDEILTQEQAQRIRVLGWVFWWSTLRTWGGR